MIRLEKIKGIMNCKNQKYKRWIMIRKCKHYKGMIVYWILIWILNRKNMKRIMKRKVKNQK